MDKVEVHQPRPSDQYADLLGEFVADMEVESSPPSKMPSKIDDELVLDHIDHLVGDLEQVLRPYNEAARCRSLATMLRQSYPTGGGQLRQQEKAELKRLDKCKKAKLAKASAVAFNYQAELESLAFWLTIRDRNAVTEGG
jgi:hypothetical protein